MSLIPNLSRAPGRHPKPGPRSEGLAQHAAEPRVSQATFLMHQVTDYPQLWCRNTPGLSVEPLQPSKPMLLKIKMTPVSTPPSAGLRAGAHGLSGRMPPAIPRRSGRSRGRGGAEPGAGSHAPSPPSNCSCSGLRSASPASGLPAPLRGHGAVPDGDSCSLDFPEEEIDSEIIKQW